MCISCRRILSSPDNPIDSIVHFLIMIMNTSIEIIHWKGHPEEKSNHKP